MSDGHIPDYSDFQYDRHLTQILTSLARIEAKQESHDHLLRGNGSLGLVTRVDRVEQRLAAENRRNSWLLSVAGTLAVGLVLNGLALLVRVM